MDTLIVPVMGAIIGALILGLIAGAYIGGRWKEDEILFAAGWRMPSFIRGEFYWVLEDKRFADLTEKALVNRESVS